MKTAVKLIAALLIVSFIDGLRQPALAQQAKTSKDSLVKSLIANQQYVFFAQSVTPMAGRQRFLTSDYTVYVSKDTVKADLPFFGRSYSASMNPSEGGINFTSVNFDYEVSAKKKGGWRINIKSKDKSDVQLLSLDIFGNGTASLQVTSNNRQPISFNGYITGPK